VDAAARQQLADILRQTRDYLGALQEDGVTRVDVSLEAAAKLAPKPRPSAAIRAKAPASPGVRPMIRGRSDNGGARSIVPAFPLVRPVVSGSAQQGRYSGPGSGGDPSTALRGASAPPSIGAAPAAQSAASGDPAVVGLQRIAAAVARCAKCPLHKERLRTVPGQGNPHPEILLVGEGPGAEEDRQGVPFVGEAGQLLTKMIEAMGLTRADVFITNVVKCRPPENRKPTPDEMAACLPYLREQIALLRPKVIVALGAVATQGLLGVETKISELRGQWQLFETIDLMPTFHPAYLLRMPTAKREAWADLLSVLQRLGRTAPPRPGASS